MRIYTFYTDSHSQILDAQIKSLEKLRISDKLVIEKYEQECEDASFESPGWNLTMRKKVQYIIETIEKGEVFIHADCDVIFFKDPTLSILNELADYDIAFQSDDLQRTWPCMGFFVCKPSELTKKLFQRVLDDMHLYSNDQITMKLILEEVTKKSLKELDNLKFKFLSDKYFTYGLLGVGRWNGQRFFTPANMITFHANWTVGVENKLRMIEMVFNDRN